MNPIGRIIRRDVPPSAAKRSPGILAGMRVRKKLIVLHTAFSLVLALILLVGVRPAVRDVVETAELHEARIVLRAILPQLSSAASPEPRDETWTLRRGTPSELKLDSRTVAAAQLSPGEPIDAATPEFPRCVVAFVAGGERGGEFALLRVTIPEARDAVWRLYLITSATLLGVYVLVALALELLVLPKNVYAPIRRLLEADRAVREGRRGEQIIPEEEIPADELGSIMRSRNEAIASLREHQARLAGALDRLEEVAADLKKKNHLLEAARRNLADADRLAGLGMMSAGIAHELNTPLAVLKGLVETLHADPRAGVSPATAALMLRVVQRLERLGEGLLDYARVRPPRSAPASLHTLVGEACTLVRLDRDGREVPLDNRVAEDLVVECDADRIVQVFVNLLRNAVEAVRAGSEASSRVEVSAEVSTREGSDWATIRVADDGPGIDPAVLTRLFEPFASTRLDARGTGLGLAVTEGIIKEHGGVILARNRTPGEGGRARGAVFEIMLPMRAACVGAPG